MHEFSPDENTMMGTQVYIHLCGGLLSESAPSAKQPVRAPTWCTAAA